MNKKAAFIFCILLLSLFSCKTDNDNSDSMELLDSDTTENVIKPEIDYRSSSSELLEYESSYDTESEIIENQLLDFMNPITITINDKICVIEEYEPLIFPSQEPEFYCEKSSEYISAIRTKMEKYIPSDYLLYEITTYFKEQINTA